MSKAATITILNQGAGVGPFNLYALDVYNNIIQTIALNVPLADLLAGYNVYNLPNAIASVKIDSNNILCTASQTVSIPTQQPPVCNCITIERTAEGTSSYTYIDCNGDDVGPLDLSGPAAVQICGSNPVITSYGGSPIYTNVYEGAACVSDECVNGTLKLENVIESQVTIANVLPEYFYSFNTPPTFPDNPQLNFPIGAGTAIVNSRIKYDGQITVVINSTAIATCFVQLFRNNVLMESLNISLVVGNNNAILNSIGAYTFNTTDEVYIIISD